MQISALLHTLDSCMGKKGKNIFFSEGYGAYHIIAIKMFDIMHTPGLLGRVKMSDIEIVQISII